MYIYINTIKYPSSLSIHYASVLLQDTIISRFIANGFVDEELVGAQKCHDLRPALSCVLLQITI